MTYKPLTENRGEELLMSYRAAFLARTFPQQEKGQELTESEAECGHTWRGWLAKYDPDTSLWRTAQCSLLEDLNESLVILPKSGMTRNGLLWEQPMLEHPIKETVFGFSVPTPVSSDATSGAVIGKNDTFYTTSTGMPRKVNQKGTDGSVGLARLVQMWPTPDANCGKRGTQPDWTPKRKSGQPAQYTINQAVRDRFPTPTAHNAKECNSPSEQNRNTPTLATHAGGKLNPMWVEWLMGWPLGWTDLKPLGMGRFPCVQQPLGES
jgi:DNA (cytosine-5)-methyltransferase 1